MGDKYCSDVGDVVSRSLTVTFDFMCLHRNLTAKTLVTVKDIHVGPYRLKQPLSKTDQPRFGELLRNGIMWQFFPNMCYKRGRWTIWTLKYGFFCGENRENRCHGACAEWHLKKIEKKKFLVRVELFSCDVKHSTQNVEKKKLRGFVLLWRSTFLPMCQPLSTPFPTFQDRTY